MNPSARGANLMIQTAPASYDGQALNAAFRAIETADQSNAKQGGEPVFSAVMLRAPNGATWRVSVDNSGTLSAAVVPR